MPTADHSRPGATRARRLFAGLAYDARSALRSLRRRPAFAATAVAIIALGIGVTVATFAVVDGVLLAPLPYRDPGRLVQIYTTFPFLRGRLGFDAEWDALRTDYPDYQRLRREARSFTDVAAFGGLSKTLTMDRGARPVTIGDASTNLLQVLGVHPARGRWFLPGEEGTGAPQLAVASHEFWQTQLGGNDDALGATVTLDGTPYTVVGVMPADFGLTVKPVNADIKPHPDLWIPFGADGSVYRANDEVAELIARLKPGVTIAAALADAEPILRGTARPDRRGARIVPRTEVESRHVRRPILLLFAATVLLLAVTCANVALLLLGECTVRERELRTRAILGAGRMRLARLLFTEAGVISVVGAGLGVVFAWWATRMAVALAPFELPHAVAIGPDVRTLSFVIGVVCLVTLAAGFTPAVLFSRDSSTGLAGGRVTRGRSRVQLAAVALQAATSVVLLAGAGVLVRSLVNERAVSLGFDPGQRLVIPVTFPRALTADLTANNLLYTRVERRLRSVPGAVGVTATSAPPFGGLVSARPVWPDLTTPEGTGVHVETAVVQENYFGAMHVAVLAGRTFDAQDASGPAVAVVNEAMARRFWPGESALGKVFTHVGGTARIVGVAANVRNRSLDRDADPMYYLPASQQSARMTVLLEMHGRPGAAAAAARRAVWSAVPQAVVGDVTTMRALTDQAAAAARYRVLLAVILAGGALAVTVAGVAGLTARETAARLRELSIRMALGATNRAANLLAVRRGLTAVLVGTLTGIGFAPLAVRHVSSYLFHVRVADPAAYVMAAVALAGSCTAATLLAARRLNAVDLVDVLREE